MKHFLAEIYNPYEDDEEFSILVGADSFSEAFDLAEQEFHKCVIKVYPEPLSEFEAEMSGLDEI